MPQASRSPSTASFTRRRVRRLRISASRLRWRGSRCCTTASAAGKSRGNPATTSLMAFSPPAEAATATRSKPAAGMRELSYESAPGTAPRRRSPTVPWNHFPSGRERARRAIRTKAARTSAARVRTAACTTCIPHPLRPMKISVLGLGYVGAVSAACLSKEGHDVIGVDPERTKVELINAGRSPIIEKDIGEMIAEQVGLGRLAATTDVDDAVRQTDLAFVCVGTPSLANGGIDLKYVRRVCEQIGKAIASHSGAPVIVIRSTMLPGTMRDVVIPTLEKHSGKRAGEEFGVCINPEFLREGTAVHDYYHPPKTVIGEVNRASGDVLANLYARIPGPMIRTDIETAEMVKYADNCWHA